METMIAEKQEKADETLEANIVFSDGSKKTMKFDGWKAYTDYLEAHYGEIEETHGRVV